MSTPDFGSRSDFYTFSPESLAAEMPDFEILREVGKGSMGIVYEARRRRDGERVALKVLPPSLTLSERALARFLREGELMARIQHPAIVRVFEHGRQGRLHFFVMEFVDGVTLEQRVQLGPLPARQAAEIAAETARALQFAHERGILHRDIKPGNLMLRENGRIAITDFGLARETGTGSMTESGAIVGTPMYMAPEQVLGKGAVGTQADIYGLGATLYQLVTAQPPFHGPTAQSVLKAVLDHEPIPVRRLRADLPKPLASIIWKAMAKEPHQRYGSALEMAEDLDRFLAGDHVLAREPNPVQRLVRAAAKRPLLTLLSLAVLILVLGAAALWRESRTRRLEACIAEAEWMLAAASAQRDDHSRPHTPQERRRLLDAAVAAAYEGLTMDSRYPRAWFVLAKAHHRLQNYRDALRALDEAERGSDHTTPEILHFRIDTLERLHDADSTRRRREDLTTLLKIDPGPYARCLLAEHLLDLAEQSPQGNRIHLLETSQRLLAATSDPDGRTAVARARWLAIQGDKTAAVASLRDATRDFQGNASMHARAAELFRRLGFSEESDSEANLARILNPAGSTSEPAQPTTNQVAVAPDEEIRGFLDHLNTMVPAIDDQRPQGTSRPR